MHESLRTTPKALKSRYIFPRARIVTCCLKSICSEIFECVFSPKIANSIFLMHNDHIFSAIDAEEG